MPKDSYNGKYRAKVVDTKDPEKRGRVRVMCPKVLGEAKSAWCEPCSPVAYDSGGDFAVPKKDEFVWVEFEDGDSNKPICVGGLWSKDKSPSSSKYDVDTRYMIWGKSKIVMKKNSLEISFGGSSIILNEEGIKLSAPKIDLN